MNNLKLPDPKIMDVAVPLNLSCGEKKILTKQIVNVLNYNSSLDKNIVCR